MTFFMISFGVALICILFYYSCENFSFIPTAQKVVMTPIFSVLVIATVWMMFHQHS